MIKKVRLAVRAVPPDALDLLEHQHGQIKRAFVKAVVPGRGRRERFDALRALLAVHEAAEEAHIHPVARKATGDAARVIGARLAEERAAKTLLRDLERSDPDRPGFTIKLARLAVTVLRHARHEERREFPLLRRGVSVPRRRMLGAESLLTQLVAPTRPHPRVNSELANKLSAPVMGPLDRGRDLALAVARRAR